MKLIVARKILQNMTEEERKEKGYKTCPRCDGKGTYSYCTLYGNVCFKCGGLGFINIKPTDEQR